MRSADFPKTIKKNLPKLREEINKKLTDLKKNQDFDYKNFGVDIEPLVSESIVELCELTSEEFFLAPNKNYFPDFNLLSVESTNEVAVDFKAWANTKLDGKPSHAANDLGTLYSMVDHIEKFGVENMYLFFIEYNPDYTIENVLFDKLYKFCELKEGGILKYRLKDGNLRPGKFLRTGKATVPNGDAFKSGLENTLPYWSEKRKQSIDEKTCNKLSILKEGMREEQL